MLGRRRRRFRGGAEGRRGGLRLARGRAAPVAVPLGHGRPHAHRGAGEVGADLQQGPGQGLEADQGGATWRDALLKGKTDNADCQRLLDGLYAEDLLGEPAGARAVRGLDDKDDGAQVRYQVGAYDRTALDASLAWLREVPGKCGQFTATDVKGGELTVLVTATPLPGVGEARESLRLKVYGESGGSSAVLTLDFAAVRVGDSALSLTNGGLDGVSANSTRQAAQLGTQRLQDVLAGKKPAARPANQEADAEG